jgi:hypothetical protein
MPKSDGQHNHNQHASHGLVDKHNALHSMSAAPNSCAVGDAGAATDSDVETSTLHEKPGYPCMCVSVILSAGLQLMLNHSRDISLSLVHPRAHSLSQFLSTLLLHDINIYDDINA